MSILVLNKGLILILIIVLLSMGIGAVNAEQVTMTVDSKHIIGTGSGTTPIDLNGFCNVVYVISERQMNGGTDKYIVQEYPVSLDDYSKIKIGDKVTLESPGSRTDFWKVISIN